MRCRHAARPMSPAPPRPTRAKKVAAAATGEVAAMLPADPPQSLKSARLQRRRRQADDASRPCRQDAFCSICGRPGARPAAPKCRRSTRCRSEMGSESFEVVAVNVDTGDDIKPKKFLQDTGVQTLGYYRDTDAWRCSTTQDARTGARPAGYAADRRRRLPARPHERTGRMVQPGRQAAGGDGTRPIGLSAGAAFPQPPARHSRIVTYLL